LVALFNWEIKLLTIDFLAFSEINTSTFIISQNSQLEKIVRS
jgi:hypothetical protein